MQATKGDNFLSILTETCIQRYKHLSGVKQSPLFNKLNSFFGRNEISYQLNAKINNFFFNLQILIKKQVSDNMLIQKNQLLRTNKICKEIATFT